MRIEMHDPQGQLLMELDCGFPQKDIAITYAYIIRQEGKTADWPKINAAGTDCPTWAAKEGL